jgi:hypothetical protein
MEELTKVQLLKVQFKCRPLVLMLLTSDLKVSLEITSTSPGLIFLTLPTIK